MELDFNELNNLLVGLRGPVQRARVHCIHKMTRQIDKLKGKKGNEKQKEQNLKKAQRIGEEVKVLADLSKDEMAR